jgi:hypothetical protein
VSGSFERVQRNEVHLRAHDHAAIPAGQRALQIENPDKAVDAKATEFGALESVLKTYQAILKQKPDAKAKPLDDLVKKHSQGKCSRPSVADSERLAPDRDDSATLK